jgi:hypothetical protein
MGHSMSQAVSRRLPEAETRVRFRTHSSEMYGEIIALGRIVIRILLFPPVSVISPKLHIHLHFTTSLIRTN